MTETQVCLLSMSSVTDCQTGGVVEFEEEGRGKGGNSQVEKGNGKREDSIARGGEGGWNNRKLWAIVWQGGELKEAKR